MLLNCEQTQRGAEQCTLTRPSCSESGSWTANSERHLQEVRSSHERRPPHWKLVPSRSVVQMWWDDIWCIKDTTGAAIAILTLSPISATSWKLSRSTLSMSMLVIVEFFMRTQRYCEENAQRTKTRADGARGSLLLHWHDNYNWDETAGGHGVVLWHYNGHLPCPHPVTAKKRKTFNKHPMQLEILTFEHTQHWQNNDIFFRSLFNVTSSKMKTDLRLLAAHINFDGVTSCIMLYYMIDHPINQNAAFARSNEDHTQITRQSPLIHSVNKNVSKMISESPTSDMPVWKERQ